MARIYMDEIKKSCKTAVTTSRLMKTYDDREVKSACIALCGGGSRYY
jgi:hypothetical protein